MSNHDKISIDVPLVQRLIAEQFPEWADLEIKPVECSGWDNKTFHLGAHMTVRLPSHQAYSAQVEKEQYWLPKLAPYLPLPIAMPLAMGHPGSGYPLHWSIYKWREGSTTSLERIKNLNQVVGCYGKPYAGHFPAKNGSTGRLLMRFWRIINMNSNRSPPRLLQ